MSSAWRQLGRWYGMLRWSIRYGDTIEDRIVMLIAVIVTMEILDELEAMSEATAGDARHRLPRSILMPPVEEIDMALSTYPPVPPRTTHWPPFTGHQFPLGENHA